jgi:hypothetical protein
VRTEAVNRRNAKASPAEKTAGHARVSTTSRGLPAFPSGGPGSFGSPETGRATLARGTLERPQGLAAKHGPQCMALDRTGVQCRGYRVNMPAEKRRASAAKGAWPRSLQSVKIPSRGRRAAEVTRLDNSPSLGLMDAVRTSRGNR